MFLLAKSQPRPRLWLSPRNIQNYCNEVMSSRVFCTINEDTHVSNNVIYIIENLSIVPS